MIFKAVVVKAVEPTEWTLQFNDGESYAAFKLACKVGCGFLDIANVDVSHQASAGDSDDDDGESFEVVSFTEACGEEYVLVWLVPEPILLPRTCIDFGFHLEVL